MEKLSIEEKAERYDKAIKRANELNYVSDKDSLQYKTVVHIFPELKESEDEKIRKYIHSHFQEHLDKTKEFLSKGMTAPFSSEEIKMLEASVAWIEKQDNNNMGISEATKKKLEGNLNKALEKETPESWNRFLEEQNELKPDKQNYNLEEEIEEWLGCEAFPEGTIITPFPKAVEIVRETANHFYDFGRKQQAIRSIQYTNSQIITPESYINEGQKKGIQIVLDNPQEYGLQKSANKIKPKFEVGDWVVTTYGKVNQVVAVDEDSDGYTLDDGTYFSGSWKEGYHLWTPNDAKAGDVLACESGWTCIFKKLVNNEEFSSYCFIDKNKWFCEKGCEYHTLNKEFMRTHNGEIKPATKEQRDTLFAKIKEEGYEWDAENKKLKKIEPMPAEWSKEDEKFFKTALWHISYSVSNGKSTNIHCDTTDWLKSLKERIQLQSKPELNKEDENTIKEVIQLIEDGALSIDGKSYYIDRLKSIGSR